MNKKKKKKKKKRKRMKKSEFLNFVFEVTLIDDVELF